MVWFSSVWFQGKKPLLVAASICMSVHAVDEKHTKEIKCPLKRRLKPRETHSLAAKICRNGYKDI